MPKNQLSEETLQKQFHNQHIELDHEHILDVLKNSTEVDASGVMVKTAGSVVILEGTVEEEKDVHVMEEIVKGLKDVSQVRSFLTLKRGHPKAITHKRNDFH